MVFPEYYDTLLAVLGILVAVFIFWASTEKTWQYRIFNALLVGIVVIVIGIGVEAIVSRGGGETGENTPVEGSADTKLTTPPTTEPPDIKPIISNDLRVGDTFTFGTYEQDGNSSNRQEPIEWVVLDKVDDKVLLLSTKAIDCQPYNNQDTGCTWATCSLRKWLNGTFYKAAFSNEERERIAETTVEAHENPVFSTNSGMDTDDYIFLLSVDEVNQYLPYDNDRMCSPTEYAKEQGVFEKKSLGTCWWWLRTPGETSSDACSVNSNGTIDTDDGTVNSDKGCVRPAMWLSIEE